MKNEIKYVAGLLFDAHGRSVALIHKTHGPAALIGKWNAIGGKIEPGEESIEGMRREFAEEAGVSVQDWTLFLRLKGPDWSVDFYHAFSGTALSQVSTRESEEVEIFLTNFLPEIVPNLKWIIPMALGHEDDHVWVYEVTEKEPFWTPPPAPKGLTVGTKSVLFGAHCFFLHPWFVAAGWWKLYGFPFDPRLWVAFFVHDLGYIGKANMDGPEGEQHPRLGGNIMRKLFGDWWADFTMLHSRYFAGLLDRPASRLCCADKLAFCLMPRWLYLPMVKATGELTEYLECARNADPTSGRFRAADYSGDPEAWHAEVARYMSEWVAAHKDGEVDTWTRRRGEGR